MEITVINISKGPLKFNNKACENINFNKLSFDITPRLRYSIDSDYLGFQIDLIVTQENTQILKDGFLIGLAVKDWSAHLKNGLDLNQNRTPLIEICRSSWLIATGIVAIQTSVDKFPGIILPQINYEEFSNEVILVPNQGK